MMGSSALPFDHVVLVSLDTLRSDCISTNPDKRWPLKYPNASQPCTDALDELIAAGCFFTNCITAAPYTSAAHASILTGRWPLHHGVYEFFNRKLTCRTLFHHAARAGYRTILKSDFPVILGDFLGFTSGVDSYIVEDDSQFLEAMFSAEKSFGLVHFGGIHIPYGFHDLRYGGDAYRRRVAELESEIPPTAAMPADRLVETFRSAEDFDLLLRYKRVIQHHYAERNYDRLFALYLEGVDHFCKTRFDPFMRRLRRLIDDRRCLIVLFGDHGEEYDEDSYGHHNSVADGVLRVPLICVGPEVKPGCHDVRVRTIDIAPTLADLLGWEKGRRMSVDGVSLVDTVRMGKAYPGRVAFAQAHTSDTSSFVSFQERAIARGRKTGSLRHVLYEETVYSDDFKLARKNYAYVEHGGISALRRCAPRRKLERLTAERRWQGFESLDVETELSALLDSYNASRGRTRARIDVSEEVREHLRMMGYRV
jgi:choline-sulfatase